MRLFNYLKNSLFLTKKEVMDLPNTHEVLVNGIKVNLSYYLKQFDVVTVDGKEIERIEYVYYMFNKPVGVTCTNNLETKSSIQHFINLPYKVSPVGRLDKDSCGLILLTNDGKFTNYVLNELDKEYYVVCKEPITESFKENIKPILIKNKMTKEFLIKYIDDYSFNIVLNDGAYHEIRKLVSSNLNQVVYLKRIRIGEYYLNDLEEGKIKEC